MRARLAACGLLIVAVWEVMTLASASRSAPTAQDWQATAAAIPATLRSDQLIVFAPRWLDPVGRKWLGSRLSLEQVARMDAAPYRDVWEVSIRGASAPEVAGETPRAERTFGPIRLRHFARDAPAVTWRVTREAHLCEVDFEPRLGALFELHHAQAQSVLDFPQAQLGSELQVFAGLADYQKRSRNRATALVQAIVDGREVSRRVVGNDDGWVALPAASTEPGPRDVRIVTRVVRTGEAIDLSVCVAAEARTRHP
jgi:hypothetical protein